jgi:hypothetical protein
VKPLNDSICGQVYIPYCSFTLSAPLHLKSVNCHCICCILRLIQLSMATWTTVIGLMCWCLLVTLVRNDVKLLPGHYPPRYCELTDVMLSMADRQFYYKPDSDVDVHSCMGVTDIWPLTAANISAELLFENGSCSMMFDVGHIFTMYYYYGSNYFHLHYDMLIPLYSAVYQHGIGKHSHAFLPTVETSRLKVL